MYTSYWNLRASPFLNADDETFLYPSEQLQEGVARLFYLIDQERIAGMVTGPYGVGKTFLLSCLVRRTQKLKLPLIRFDAIPQGGLPMARHILRQIGVEDDVPTLADALMRLQQHCLDGGRNLVRHVLFIDEAQYLSDGDGLYLVHFLCNLRIRSAAGEKPLFTTVLSGTPSLARSVEEYESLRRRALDEVHRLCGGIPRSINNLCDTSLMLGYAAGARAITPDIVREAAEDTGLAPSSPASNRPPAAPAP